MIDQSQVESLKEVLDLSKTALVIFPETKNLDLIAASYSFYHFLEEIFPNENKENLRLLAPGLDRNSLGQLKNLLGISDLQNELGKENLLISFPYKENQVDKVSYHIGENSKRFYLTIKPKKGVSPLDKENIEFSYSGTDADLLILMGVDELSSLENLYFGYEDLYKGLNNQVVTLNNFLPDFGNLNLDISGRTSYSEAVFYILKDLSKLLGKDLIDILAKTDIPTLLLFGIDEKTNSLSSRKASAETFLAVGELLQMGARRIYLEEEKKEKSFKPKLKEKSKKESVPSPKIPQKEIEIKK